MDEARPRSPASRTASPWPSSNSARSSVLSGDPEAIDRILAALEAREVFCRRVKVDVASHSPQVEPLLGELTREASATCGRIRPRAHLLLDGARRRWSRARPSGPAYWARNLREPVRFAAAVQALVAAGHDTFIEMGPHPVLVGAIQQGLSDQGDRAIALPSSRRELGRAGYLARVVGRAPCERSGARLGPPLPVGPCRIPAPLRLAARAILVRRCRGLPRRWPPSRAVEVRSESEPKKEVAAGALFEVAWREATSSAPPSATDERPWLVLSDRRGVGHALAGQLVQLGSAVASLEWDAGLNVAAAWTRLTEDRWGRPWSRWAGIVHLWSLDAPDFESAPRASLREAVDRDSLGLIGIVRALGAHEGGSAPRLYVVTAGAQAVAALRDVDSPAGGPLVGARARDRCGAS